MNTQYKEYLQSKEWKEFRKKILVVRKVCQYCSCRFGNQTPNIHHINYKNIFHESADDVLVLCQTCHLLLHKRKKWEKAKKNREDMHFTKLSEKNIRKNKYYQIESTEFRPCIACGKEHCIFYKTFEKVPPRLAMICPESKPRTKFIRMEKGLNIPIVESR